MGCGQSRNDGEAEEVPRSAQNADRDGKKYKKGSTSTTQDQPEAGTTPSGPRAGPLPQQAQEANPDLVEEDSLGTGHGKLIRMESTAVNAQEPGSLVSKMKQMYQVRKAKFNGANEDVDQYQEEVQQSIPILSRRDQQRIEEWVQSIFEAVPDCAFEPIDGDSLTALALVSPTAIPSADVSTTSMLASATGLMHVSATSAPHTTRVVAPPPAPPSVAPANADGDGGAEAEADRSASPDLGRSSTVASPTKRLTRMNLSTTSGGRGGGDAAADGADESQLLLPHMVPELSMSAPVPELQVTAGSPRNSQSNPASRPAASSTGGGAITLASFADVSATGGGDTTAFVTPQSHAIDVSAQGDSHCLDGDGGHHAVRRSSAGSEVVHSGELVL